MPSQFLEQAPNISLYRRGAYALGNAMPHVFFDVVVDGNVTKDTQGLDILDKSEVEWHAVMAVAEVMREEAAPRKTTSVTVQVLDGTGTIMLIAEATVKTSWVI